jgi:hypothetical protein
MEEEHLSDEGSSLDEIWSSLDNELHPCLAKVHVQMRRWIAEVLPAAVELTRADLMARKGLGLSLAPLVGGVLAAAATACGSHSAGTAVAGMAATSEPPERAAAVDQIPTVLPVPTVDQIPTVLPVPTVDSVPTVLRATTLVLLRYGPGFVKTTHLNSPPPSPTQSFEPSDDETQHPRDADGDNVSAATTYAHTQEARV